jgi:hypothetical protein
MDARPALCNIYYVDLIYYIINVSVVQFPVALAAHVRGNLGSGCL